MRVSQRGRRHPRARLPGSLAGSAASGVCARAAASNRFSYTPASGLLELKMMATVTRRGTASLSSSSHFPGMPSVFCKDNPVRLPPGRARLSTRPASTGSPIPATTIGIDVVACLAAIAAEVPVTMMRSTRASTRSRISAGYRSTRPSAQRSSITRLRPSVQPNSCRRSENVENPRGTVEGDPV